MLHVLNLEGDQQADLSVHGGKNKAVYVYPSEHYEYWNTEYPDINLPWGMFGENFTTQGLLEDSVNIGDQLQIGEAMVMVTQPRLPCYKLQIKFGRKDIVQRFMQSGRLGFYISVVQEGMVGVGDAIITIHRDKLKISVADLIHYYLSKEVDLSFIKKILSIPALPENWKQQYRMDLKNIEGEK
jgi:MOSC domain-containing protein YiiM